ncbi:Os05g0320300, partial [Oryza sativa Japonica Group]
DGGGEPCPGVGSGFCSLSHSRRRCWWCSASGSSGKVKRIMKTPYQLEVLKRTYTVRAHRQAAADVVLPPAVEGP